MNLGPIQPSLETKMSGKCDRAAGIPAGGTLMQKDLNYMEEQKQNSKG